MRTILLFLFLCFYLFPLQAQLLHSTNFESQAVGTAYTRPLWQADGFTTDTWDNGLASRTYIDNSTSVSGTKSLRVTYPAGEYGPGPNGAQVPLKFSPLHEAYMSYWVRFSDNFSWGTTSEGGKLPGLAGGARCSGCATCTGSNGFSARLMWRPGGKAILYLYHIDKVNTCGDNLDLVYPGGTNVVFKKGEWYHVMQRVKINSSPSSYDGEVEVWINGEPVLLTTGYRFVTNSDKVDNLYFSTFHGGSDATWAPTVTCYTWFDDVKIGTTKAAVDFVSCKGPDAGANKTLCGVSSLTLDAGVSETNASFLWTKNGNVVGNTKSISVISAGTYIVTYDSLGCIKKDTVEVTNTLSPNLGTDRTICTSSFETLDANIEGIGIVYEWYKNGIQIPDAHTRTLTIKDAATYKVTTSASGCITTSSELILSSGLLQINDVQGAAGSTTQLTVQNSGSNYSWFSQSTGGSALFTGKTYETMIPTSETYVYAQDNTGYNGLVGKALCNTSTSYTDDRFDRRMKFEVYRTLRIDSITVYTTALQNVTIRILANNQTTVVYTITHTNLAAGEQRIAIGAELPAGVYYMDAAGTTNKLRHSYEADTDIHFPYTVSGLISIQGSNLAWIDAKPYYLFFYNWRVTAGNWCARTPVLLSPTKTSTITQTIALQQGWNLLSFYVHPTDSSIATLFTNKDVQEIKNNDGFWSKNNTSNLQSLTNLSAGEGYLVKMNAATILAIEGITKTQSLHISPNIGWQLIGCPFASSSPFSSHLNSLNSAIIKNFEGFWEPNGTNNSIMNFEPGKAYYLKK